MTTLVMQSHSQRDDDGGSPLPALRKNSGHMARPDVGMTTMGACATPRDQDSEDNAATNDDNKDCFSCSCPSAPLSSACSISSASGLSSSPFLSHSVAGQATTPLSMEGSDYNAEGEPALRKLGRPPTPFDAMAGLSTLDDLVTLAPQNAPEETEESVGPVSREPPTPLLARPPDPLNTTPEFRQPQDVSSPELRDGRHNDVQHDPFPPAESPAPGRGVPRKDADDTRASLPDEPAKAAFPDDTDHRRDRDHANGCAQKCDDAPDASQQPTDATLTGDFGQTRAPVLGGCQRPNQEKQLQQRGRQRCRQTEPAAAAAPEPRSGAPALTVPVCGEIHAARSGVGGPGTCPASRPSSLNHSDSSANTHHPCIPEHDIPRPIDPSANGPSAAARDRKINNTNPISQNSSQTATASRDSVPPFSSRASPPSHPSLFSPPFASSSVSIEHEESPPPLVRTTSDNSSLRIQHPIPDINPKTGAFRGNIAQLEATAERLSSTTASIEDAIRGLHAELKRSDSQKSAAARARTGVQSSAHEADDTALASRLRRAALPKYPSASALARRRTHSGRTVTVNTPSRYRPRSSSLNTVMQASADMDPYLSRTGPGKGSVRSVRTGKQSLAEISESEPISLTRAAFDEADRSNMADEDDDTIRPPTGHDKTPKRESFAPSTDAFHAMLNSGGRAPNSELFFDHTEPRAMQYLSVDEQRPVTSASNASSTHTSNAFRDFDGVHCDPEANSLPPSPQPTSYLDQETGQDTLFYPARVPAMLSLPPKLSKKPKAAARNQRQSHVLSTMPEIARRSGAAWLPDPLAGNSETSFLNPISLDMDDSFRAVTDQSPRPDDHIRQTTLRDETTTLDPNQGAPEIHVTPTPADAVADDDEVKPAAPRPPKDNVADTDARKSSLSKYNSNLPPQLRASAYFDMPSTSTKLEVEDGSATATLDHLLDASTHAPVNAFTDHMIAGKLGSEIYGAEKRRSPVPKPQQSQPDLKEADAKKRGSMFSRVKSEDFDRNARSESGTSGPADDEALPPGAVGYATLSPGSDELDDNDKPDGEEALDDEDEDNEEYYGPPTTLLAELQMRKQQQKNRTRPMNQAFPNGMHATLLELDAVAEEQRKSRNGKRVNLAWEDPGPMAADAGSDDEDVPLGVLFAARAAGTNGINAVSAELNRPPGLMERRQIEENEPLSHRRARLQGQDPGHKRQTLMPNSATRMGAHRLSQMPSLAGLPVHHHQRTASPGTAEREEEVEGETLGERMRRLKKKEEEELPKARPVSASFSAELLGQFADPEDEKKKEEEASAAKEGTEEETLGQRRRRLQAEREGQSLQPPAAHHASASPSTPAKRLSMANILSAHPRRDTALQEEERRRAQEDVRVQRAQGEKLAAMRSQMPASLEKPSVGAAAGGFGNGRFNDGEGGTGRRVSRGLEVPGVDLSRSSVVLGGGMVQQAGVSSMMGPGGQYAGGYGAPQQYHGAAGQYSAGMPSAGWYPQMQAPMGMPVQPQVAMQMPMPVGMGMPSPGHSDPIEMWRHSVMP